MSAGLTKNQADLLAFIRHFIGQNDRSPSFDEMLAGVALKSKSGISRLLDGLEQRGHIRRSFNRARSIEIVDRTRFGAHIEQHLRAYCAASGKDRDSVIRQAVEQFLEVVG